MSLDLLPGEFAVTIAPDGDVPIERAWPLLTRLEKMAIGSRSATGEVDVRRSEPAGCLLYGPYWRLSAGFYRLVFRCTASRAPSAPDPVLGVEILVLNRFQQAWRDYTAAELRPGAVAIDFEVPPELSLESGNEGRFEFKFFHLGNADLRIESVDLLRRDEPAAVEASYSWRLLGRLQKTLRGRRHAAGEMRVRRSEAAGCFLYGAWPYLRLSGGFYRLSISGRAERARLPGQPVLGVEILGASRWRGRGSWRSAPMSARTGGVRLAWRDFTAEELDGRSVVDFEVPTELGTEAGEDAPFDFRLHHLGNADLAIDAVDLCRIADEAPADIRPPTWRMLGRLRKGLVAAWGAGGLKVARSERPGRLLSGARPDLDLGSGHYRVTVECRARPEDDATAAVLDVEVTLRPGASIGEKLPRWIAAVPGSVVARRELTAGDLRDGSASLDFEVPEHAGHASGNAIVDLRLNHTGRADLVITAATIAEVERTGDDHDPSGFPSHRPRPRLRRPVRRKIVIIGNCQSDILKQVFVRTESLNRLFEAKYHFVEIQKNLYEFAKRDLDRADILLVQDVHAWENFPLRSYIRDDIETIRYPLLRFASLWPFDSWNGPDDKEARIAETPNLTFPYLDGLLARLRKEIPDREERLRVYRSLDWPGIINYQRLHDIERRRLLAVDAKFGVEIGAFVMENFQRRPIFYTTVRPSREVFDMLMQFVLGSLGIRERHPLPESLDALLATPQLPVHPKVAAALGVKWADEATTYLYKSQKITWETYVRSYIEHYG